jgi:hypothetical protein
MACCPAGLGHQPQAAHAGIHLEVDRDGLPGGAGGFVQRLGGSQPGDALDQVVLDQACGKGREGRIQNENGHLEPILPQGDSFVDAGHGQHVGTGRQGGAGHRSGPVTVAIGLDHGHEACPGACDAPQFPDVVVNGPKIDFSPDVRKFHGRFPAFDLLIPCFCDYSIPLTVIFRQADSLPSNPVGILGFFSKSLL